MSLTFSMHSTIPCGSPNFKPGIAASEHVAESMRPSPKNGHNQVLLQTFNASLRRLFPPATLSFHGLAGFTRSNVREWRSDHQHKRQ